MPNTDIKIVYGGGTFSADTNFCTLESVKEVLKVLEENGVKNIDTAQSYPNSEELLGRADAASRFLIDTKDIGALAGGTASKQDVIARGEASLKKLHTDKVCCYFFLERHVSCYMFWCQQSEQKANFF